MFSHPLQRTRGSRCQIPRHARTLGWRRPMPWRAASRVDAAPVSTLCCDGWNGVPALVNALQPYVHHSPMDASTLLGRLEPAVRASFPSVRFVNPRGESPRATDDDEDLLPAADRFEIGMDASWADRMAEGHELFAALRAEMRAQLSPHAPRGAEGDGTRDGVATEFWRVVVSYPGAAAQEWYTDGDPHDPTPFQCVEVDLVTDADAGTTVFEAEADTAEASAAAAAAAVGAEPPPPPLVAYTSVESHAASAHRGGSVRVTLLLVLSEHGDPSDALATPDSTSSEMGEGSDTDDEESHAL